MEKKIEKIQKFDEINPNWIDIKVLILLKIIAKECVEKSITKSFFLVFSIKL